MFSYWLAGPDRTPDVFICFLSRRFLLFGYYKKAFFPPTALALGSSAIVKGLGSFEANLAVRKSSLEGSPNRSLHLSPSLPLRGIPWAYCKMDSNLDKNTIPRLIIQCFEGILKYLGSCPTICWKLLMKILARPYQTSRCSWPKLG